MKPSALSAHMNWLERDWLERNGAEERKRLEQEREQALRRREDDILCRAIEVLRARGKDELASQLAAVRFEEPRR